MANDGQTSINIPQLIAVAVVGFLAIRWFMSKPSPIPSASSSARRAQTIDPGKIERLSTMFPQVDRRTIAWDLQRNGQNVEATAERVLSGRGLDNPPPTFQPVLPSDPASAGNGSSRSSGSGKGEQRQDLISRYNLQNKVHGKGKEPVTDDGPKKAGAWSSDRATRAETLKNRREEMILAARRKMVEKEASA